MPGNAATKVGGDWFDVTELPGHRTAMVVGDVVGRGLFLLDRGVHPYRPLRQHHDPEPALLTGTATVATATAESCTFLPTAIMGWRAVSGGRHGRRDAGG